MESYAPSISRLIEGLQRLPGIGEKTATRLAMYILSAPDDYAHGLARSIMEVKETIKLCSVCFNLSDSNPCHICSNGKRRDDSICVVEEVKDLMAVERSGFSGRYHVLHGVISPLKGIGPDDIKIRELVDRVKNGGVSEVIIATNPNLHGEATATYITKLLKPLGVRITRIAFGIPMGGALEYIDDLTLSKAFEGRRDM